MIVGKLDDEHGKVFAITDYYDFYMEMLKIETKR